MYGSDGRRIGPYAISTYNALDEAIALPTDFSARIARNTQLYIQDETKVCKLSTHGAVPTM